MTDKKWVVIPYMRIVPEDLEPMTKEEAIKEAEHLSFLQPENIYQVERLEEDSDVVH